METATKERRRAGPILGFVFSFLAMLAMFYFTGVVFFQDRFQFRTTFQDQDISFQKADVIESRLEKETNARTLTLLELNDKTETIRLAEDIGYTRYVEAPENGWIDPDAAWRWPASLFRATDLTTETQIEYSQEELEDVISELDVLDPDKITEPQDAYLKWEDDICYIVPEEEGSLPYRARLVQLIKQAIREDVGEIDLDQEGCYQKPSVYSDDEELNATLARYEAVNFQRIIIDLSGAEVTLSPDDILSYYQGDASDEMELDEEAVSDFVSDLKERYDTYEHQRPFVNTYGDQIMVGSSADTYGFQMNYDETLALVLDAFRSRKTTNLNAVWVVEGQERDENGCDVGDTYIEVSIDNQRLWAYIDGELILSTDVVTGNVGNHDTPRGVFSILYMTQDEYLEGEGYRTFVDVWMPLTWSGVGLHNAPWRSSFGGDIYTYSGSHGCINLSYSAASDLYWSYSAGTPVVIW